MEYVQLIEKVDLEDGVWMTFWATQEKVRLSMEVREPSRHYEIGSVYLLDRTGDREGTALRDDYDESSLSGLGFPIEIPRHPVRKFFQNVKVVVRPSSPPVGSRDFGGPVIFTDTSRLAG